MRGGKGDVESLCICVIRHDPGPVGVTAITMRLGLSLSEVLAIKGFPLWSVPIVSSLYLAGSILRMRQVATRHAVVALVFLFWMLVPWLRAGEYRINVGTLMLIAAAYLYGLLLYARYRATQ